MGAFGCQADGTRFYPVDQSFPREWNYTPKEYILEL